MAELKTHGVTVEDIFCETFDAHIARILITSSTRKWAREAALQDKGLGRSATTPPCEAYLEREVSPVETPDGRPGFIVQMMDRKRDELAKCLFLRIRKGVLPYPKASVYEAMPPDMTEDFIETKGSIIQAFGDGFEEQTEAYGRKIFKIPRMDGWFHVEERFGTREGPTGAMFIIYANSDESALESAELVLEAISGIPHVVGKFASSGSKIGAKNYKDVVATTNEEYYPALIGRDGNKLRNDIKCVYEVILSGLKPEDVCSAMKASIERATTVEGVLAITAANYGGNLGKGQILLHSLFK
jgi:formylmethanofuran--tetrahydromethanopterin N-formyltransferase